MDSKFLIDSLSESNRIDSLLSDRLISAQIPKFGMFWARLAVKYVTFGIFSQN